jgi:death-on-curing protein
LDLVLDLPTQGIYGKELYPSIWEKAAVYLMEIIIQHICEGGCKRTAFIATATFLRYNGYYLEVNEKEADDFCVSIASKQIPLKDVANWLTKHSKKV